MKIINGNIESDRQNFIKLLEAANTNEVVLYEGVRCTIKMEPPLNSEKIANIVPSKECYNTVTCASGGKGNIIASKGLLYQTTYEITVLEQFYSILVPFKNSPVVEIKITIQSESLQKLKALDDTDAKKFIEENFEKTKSTCTIS